MNNDYIYDGIYSNFENADDVDECYKQIKEYLKTLLSNNEIKNYKIDIDSDVFDSCGLDIMYIHGCFIDNNDNICLFGNIYYSE